MSQQANDQPCCPICSASQDTGVKVPGSGAPVKPTAGSVTYCFTCSSWLTFNAAGNLVVPDTAMQRQLENDPGMWAQVQVVRMAMKSKPSLN